MSYSELAHEAAAGLRAYRQTLIDMHTGVADTVDLEEIKARLAADGFILRSPVVTIPYSVQALENVNSLSEEHVWTDPFTADSIEDAYKKVCKRGEGESAYKAGVPYPFWTAVLGIAVVFDDTDLYSLDFGEIYARGNAIDASAHELAHSALAGVTSKCYHQTGEARVQIHIKEGISQVPQTVTLVPGGREVLDYEPTWIDEAAATHGAAEVRCDMYPQSVPKKSEEWVGRGADFYGLARVEIPPKYLVVSGNFPDSPGIAGCAAAGIGMDILAAKRPSLLPSIIALSAGKLAITEFHQDLRDQVGAALYADITECRPYNAWGMILEQILDLN
jgi:hypothetical protein